MRLRLWLHMVVLCIVHCVSCEQNSWTHFYEDLSYTGLHSMAGTEFCARGIRRDDKHALEKYRVDGTLLWSVIQSGLNREPRTAIRETEDGGCLALLEMANPKQNGTIWYSLLLLERNGSVRWRHTLSLGAANYLRALEYMGHEHYLIAGTALADVTGVPVGVLGQINQDGTILWMRKFHDLPPIHLLTLGYNAQIYVASSPQVSAPSFTQITAIGGKVWHVLSLPVFVYAVAGAMDGGCVLVGGEGLSEIRPGPATAVKYSATGTLEWIRRFALGEMSMFQSVSATTDNGFIIGGRSSQLNITSFTHLHAVLYKLRTDGTVLWSKRFGQMLNILAITQVSAESFIASSESTFRISMLIRYTNNQSNAGCRDAAVCRVCGLGFYWTGQRCDACVPGCLTCENVYECLICGNQYYLNSSRQCVLNETVPFPLCDCTQLILSSECMDFCNITYCSHTVITNYLNESQRTCLCKNNTIDNGTHCLPIIEHSCPSLCLLCIAGNKDERCLKCANVPNIVSLKLQPPFLMCNCSDGYIRNGSECTAINASHAGIKKSNFNAMMVLAIFAAFVGVVGVFWAIYRRASSQQHSLPRDSRPSPSTHVTLEDIPQLPVGNSRPSPLGLSKPNA